MIPWRGVGITATRYGLSLYQTETLRHRLGLMRNAGFNVLSHGDCVGGDETAHGIGLDLGYAVHIYPPSDPKLRAYCQGAANVMVPAMPYLKRNRLIVKRSVAMIGCPQSAPQFDVHGGFVRNGGTWYTIEFARSHGVPVLIIDTNGRETWIGEP